MKKLSVLLAGLAVCCFAAPAFAAPVFPDVPEEHWARDAVANLAASGLVEGYPDGTFKGNRAATRYEMAMVIARFLAKNDQEHATFATKADLEELRRLVNQLKSELDALGVRVTNLEDSVASLDKRVTELERITFYGELDAIFTTQGFKSKSKWSEYMQTYDANGDPIIIQNEQTDQIYAYLGTWTEAPTSYLTTIPQRNAGSVQGANLSIVNGAPMTNYKNGRPLTSGTGVSAVAKLGINAKVSDDVDAGLELAAYTAVGDPLVNSFYGVQQPYMSNVFAGQGNYFRTSATGNAADMLTTVTLDNFWVKHKPSGIKLTVGSFDEMNMDPILFAGQPNPNMNGTAYIPNYGFKVNGTANFLSDMDWEIFYTSLPDANINNADPQRVELLTGQKLLTGQNMLDGRDGYNTYAYGLDLGWRFKGGNFKIGYLRAMNDGTNWGLNNNTRTLSGVSSPYVPFAIPALDSYNPLLPTISLGLGIIQGGLNWGNPIEYYHRKGSFVAPVGHNENVANVFGEQSTTNWSAHLDYTWEDSKIKPRFFIEYAGSDYKPTHESDYSVSGSALRAGLGATFFNDSLDVDIQYKSIEPTYDPMILRYPVNVNPISFPAFNYYNGMYQLHDSDIYTNNRQGWDFKLTYRFKDDKGKAWVLFQTYEQVKTNSPNTLNPAYDPLTGEYKYYGFKEAGFIDAFFTPIQGYVGMFDYTGAPVGVNSWDDNKGKTKKFDIGINYKFENNLGLELDYYKQNFKRDTNLRVNQLYWVDYGMGVYDWSNFAGAAAADYIDLDVTGFHIGISYPFNEKFTGKIGYDYTALKGHYDPILANGAYALQTGSHDYTNIDTKQSVPYIGFDYKLSKNTEWGLNLRFFNTTDDASLYSPMPGLIKPTNLSQTVMAHPNDWSGTQLTTEFKVKF